MMILREKYQNRIMDAFRLLPIVVLIGARQVGKTSIMKMYPTSGFKNHVFLNGQDPEVAMFFEQLSTLEKYLKTYLNDDLDGLLMIDEFQFIDNIATMLKLLTDKYDNLKVLCSGSSSLDIQQKIDESLAGRVRLIEVFSLSFSEYLLFKDEKLYHLYNSLTDESDVALTAVLNQVYQEYLIYGGLPRTALTQNLEDKVELLNDIYQTYLLHDVRRYVANEHFVGFGRLLRFLANQTGNLININELSRASQLPYRECEMYVNLLVKMYVIKLIPPYFTNRRKVISKMKKVYFCDLGLRNIIYGSFNDISLRPDNGAIFENGVLLELLRNRKGDESLYFYRTHNGTEVDFVVDGSRRRAAVECKYKTFSNPVSIASLNNFCDEEAIEQRYVVNRNASFEHRGVKFVPGVLCNQILL